MEFIDRAVAMQAPSGDVVAGGGRQFREPPPTLAVSAEWLRLLIIRIRILF
jgi:hypothetical protein